MKTNIKGLLQPYSGEPRDFVLDFGKHKGVALQNVPVPYLRWISDCVTNRPEVVPIVRRYLNAPVGDPSRTTRIENLLQKLKQGTTPAPGLKPKLPVEPALRASREEGDIHFEPYVFQTFQHPMMGTTIGGVSIMDIPLQKLEEILERHPNPKLQDFVTHRCLHLYKWFVHDRYQKALRLDVSQFTPGEALQYEQCLNLCRLVQNVLDTITDPELAVAILRSPRFDSVCNAKLPRSA